MPLSQAIPIPTMTRRDRGAARGDRGAARRPRALRAAAKVTNMSVGAADITRIRSEVGAALDEFLARERRDLARISADLLPCVDAIADLLAGGKRLRAAFCYWGWRGCGGADGSEIFAASAALELLHASALVHDDVMDASDTRRGQPSFPWPCARLVNVALNEPSMLMPPMLLGPNRRMPLERATSTRRSCARRPSSLYSAKPELSTIASGTRFSAHPATAAGTDAAGTAIMAQSSSSGISCTEG